MSDENLDRELLATIRAAQRAFGRRLDPVRPELHRYCRRLTGNVWDAEDLVQETLTRAFARAADTRQTVDRVLPWLLRIATNAYIDGWRRPAPVPVADPVVEPPAAAGTDPLEVRDALSELAVLLPPQERAALVLKDVFDLPLAEIAAMLATSVGAVKAALHRGRERLGSRPGDSTPGRRPTPDRRLLDSMAEAFTAYDLDRLTALLLTHASSEVVGMVYNVGADAMGRGALRHTLIDETDVRYRAEVADLDGEAMLLLWETPVDGSLPAAVSDVLRVETADEGIARIRWYYFCPETIREVADRLGRPARPHGYRL